MANGGRLIAIMLGRLEMDIDECVLVYNGLMKALFEEKSSRFRVGWSGRIKAQFDSNKLKAVIEEVITRHNPSSSSLFNDGKQHGCKV